MAAMTYPLLTVVDDSGVVTSGATVTISTVTDKAGVTIASHGATVNQAGPNVSVDYDAATKGEAWVTLAVSKIGSTFTGSNAAPAFFLASQRLSSDGLDTITVETGLNARQALSLKAAHAAGSVDVDPVTGTVTIYAAGLAVNPGNVRITATTSPTGRTTTIHPPI